ncbi:MAG: hemolysin family protein [Fimbriimonadaceae bacterium]
MSPDDAIRLLVSVALIVANGFLVASEYALVGLRRGRIESLARRGDRSAGLVLQALDGMSRYVAGIQIGITMLGLAVGSYTEPFVTRLIQGAFHVTVPFALSYSLSMVVTTFVFVVVGELVPKYITLERAERVALFAIRPLRLLVLLLTPIVWLVQRVGSLLVRPFGIKVDDATRDRLAVEDLMTLVRAGGLEGTLKKQHADMVSKALRVDTLMAKDMMVHRLDIRWIDIATPAEEVLSCLAEIPYTRVPVCNGDIDEMVGIVYLHDVVRRHVEPDFSLAKIARAPEFIPENLTLDRIIERMRDTKTQILIVIDEYGGTSGLLTLEDVAEEVFGDLEDKLESERPAIEPRQGGRISARADVRMDEVVAFLGLDPSDYPETDSLATLVTEALERVPKVGDTVETALGLLRVENMARRRILRVGIQLNPEVRAQLEPNAEPESASS